MKRKKPRNKDEMQNSILLALHKIYVKKLRTNQLIRKANLSYEAFKKYTKILEGQDYIKVIEEKGKTYFEITDKGQIYAETIV